ncbi:RidA family protein [Aeromonas sp. HMWF016]|uniref:RidA family protein n=1 Tax=Aeromonas sp. HMWF016 TaxID=2056852 RepID=UPI001C627F11|nr:RidA family protein [Aeromonas sp. HMWF016]
MEQAEVDAIYTKYFPAYLPARTVIAVRELPAGARIQWLWVYNHERPNMALDGYTPKQHLAKAA